MASEDIALMAHLMRRAGFGANREELERRVAKGYDATVDELVDADGEQADRLEFLRYHPGFDRPITHPRHGKRFLAAHPDQHGRPLEEKMVLFWHHLFATGQSKVDNYNIVINQINMFREHALGNYRDFLGELAKDPAMIYWLDNCDNHGVAVNENWGRELLELFSMGVGSYTEVDVREASRAFTGWTFDPGPPRNYYSRYDWEFLYRDEDHDDGEKTFLGHTGRLNGEDIINIVCDQPATARFIARHLYSFFVADEPQVPAWSVTPPRDPAAIDLLANTFLESKADIKSILRVLFKSEFFQERSLRQGQEPGGDRGQHLPDGRRHGVPRPRHR